MRVRKLRAAASASSGLVALPLRIRKMAYGISVRLPIRIFALFAVALSLMLFLGMMGAVHLFESDEQFIERQRLLRRARELRRNRAERQHRYHMTHSTHGLLPPSRGVDRDGSAGPPSNTSLQRAKSGVSQPDTVQPDAAQPDAAQPDSAQPDSAQPNVAPAPPQRLPPASALGKQRVTASDAAITELELHWDEDSSANKVCRIRRACLQKDGSILVPGWMRSQQEKLESCGASDLRFMVSAAEWNSSSSNANVDLLGILPVRYHIPHFVTDLLPALYAQEVLRPTFSDPQTRGVDCTRADGVECDAARLRGNLNYAMLTEDRVGGMSDDAWVPQLVAMLPKRPALAFPRVLFGSSTRSCFRSIIAYSPHSYVRRGRHWYGPKHALFARNQISRESVRRAPDARGVCKVQITILNRFGWLRRGGYLVGRDIVNVDDILHKLEQVQHDARYKGQLQLEVAIEYFENTEFRDQVAIMQKADVILGVHGAGLGNLLFARLDAPFIEVLPFGYYAGPFERLADALHLQYHSIVSEPDTPNFYECISSRARQLGRPDIATRGKSMWREALGQWKGGETRVLNSQDFRDPDTSPIKLCARSQRMKLDVGETVKLLLQSANSICMGKEN